MKTPLKLFVNKEPGLLSGVPGSLRRSNSMNLCSVHKCLNASKHKGMCGYHYDLNRRLSDPNRSEYEAWNAMKNRCSPKSSRMYPYYYGRGIRVCDRWLHSFENFLQDMGKKPSKLHTLDRINNDGDYEPSNCRWATRQEQALNRRVHNLNSSGVAGVHFFKSTGKWRARIKIAGESKWLGTFDTKAEAMKARKQAEKERSNSV